MQAPLGRAVIGGLVMSTFATLLVLPSIFAVVIGRKAARSPSIYPDDPESAHYDPRAPARRGSIWRSGLARTAGQPAPSDPPTDANSHARGGRDARLGRASPIRPPVAWRTLMRRTLSLARFAIVPAGCRRLVFWLLAALGAPGCGGKAKTEHTSVAEPPTVQVIHPQIRTIVRVIGQPSFIESYERTSIYPKLTAYIEKWNVDIGDKVKKGDTLATLFVPELVEDFGTKNATVELDKQRIELAQKLVTVADADVKAARARPRGGQGDPGQIPGRGRPLGLGGQTAQEGDREGRRRPPDPPGVDQSAQVEHRRAGRGQGDHHEGRRRSCSPERPRSPRPRSASPSLAPTLRSPTSEARRLKAWVGYLTLTAPYDGVIVARNANTGDFVLPATGDPTAMQRAPHLSPGGAAPIYVVDRTDVVRIFVDVPEQDANYVKIGTKASVLVQAYRDEPLAGHRHAHLVGTPCQRAGRSAPRSTCPTRAASSCPECTPTPR